MYGIRIILRNKNNYWSLFKLTKNNNNYWSNLRGHFLNLLMILLKIKGRKFFRKSRGQSAIGPLPSTPGYTNSKSHTFIQISF